jgi:hypothetical protein
MKMSPKVKVLLVNFICSALIFLITWTITIQIFTGEYSIWATLFSVTSAFLLAPKPNVEETQPGVQYGLKSIFFKTITPIK